MRQESRRFWTKCDKIQQAEPTCSIHDCSGELYALLVGGEDDELFRVELLANVRNTLTSSGVNPSCITVLPNASKSGLEQALKETREVISPNDTMFFYLMSHGTFLKDGRPAILLSGCETIDPIELSSMSREIHYNYALFYFGNCIGGAFATALGYGNNITISSVATSDQIEGESFRETAKRAERSGAINFVDPKRGDYFANELFYYLFERKSSVESAFEGSVFRNTALLRKGFDYCACLGKIIPQLRWQNADPSKLYLRKN